MSQTAPWSVVRTVSGLAAACGLVLAASAPASAQLAEATLSGSVVDATDSALAGASVVVRHEATSHTRLAATDGSGRFHLAGLPPGTYEIVAESSGFRSFHQGGVRLAVGRTTELTIRLAIADLTETVSVSASQVVIATSSEGRLADTFGRTELEELPVAQRDVFGMPKLSAGATIVPGSASSTKLSSSPVVTVHGNRYRGNNYVLDGAMNANPNNSGEPALVPSLEAVEEVQVQTLNFGAEFGRGNASVVNVRTRSGTNDLRGRLWEHHRNDALNARNFFASEMPRQSFHQFGATLGGPISRNRTFFFGVYEGTRNAISRPYAFQVETPELREHVARTAPGSVAARLLAAFPAPTPEPGAGDSRYLDERMLDTPDGPIPAIGRAHVLVDDDVRFDQYLVKVDHEVSGANRLSVRWIAEHQRDDGGTSSSQATLGRALRGSRGPFSGVFSNLNVGYRTVAGRIVNDARASLQTTETERGAADAVVPGVTITGMTAPFGDVFLSGTRLRTVELRNITTLDRGRHVFRAGLELRRISKDLGLGTPSTGAFTFTSLADFVADRPFRQTVTVDPTTGLPVRVDRYFTQYESGAFVQHEWSATPRLRLSTGLRHDYFGTVSERDGRLSSIVLGPGETFREQLAAASIGRVDRLYRPERGNFGPRVGLAWDPTGRSRTSVRSGFSMAYQPHHGQSISGARALPPDAIQAVIQPSNQIGTEILYDIPVPDNPELARGLNAHGGVLPRPGEPPIRTTGFVVNPAIKTQYTMSWFLSTQQRLGEAWMAELGYVGTRGVNLERIDDVNRFAGDLLDGREDRINPHFGTVLFVTNGVSSRYHALTAELRRSFAGGFSLQANYRWSKWLDTASDTSTGQFEDNAEPGKGAQDIDCLRCERAPSLFDVPHRLSIAAVWHPAFFDGRRGPVTALARGWQIAGVFGAQSGRPFSVWNGASFGEGGDYNADGGGGAVGGGFYDRPDAPPPGAIPSSFSQRDFLNGLFDASVFPAPPPGQNGTLGRNTFRGPRYVSLDLSVSRVFALGGARRAELRLDAFNALNDVNLFLPNADLSLASFGKSTQAFDARVLQIGVRLLF